MGKAIVIVFIMLLCLQGSIGFSQVKSSNGELLAPTPPMGWMTWNYFGVDFNEQTLREMADAMVASGMVKAGYKYLMIDDGWQGGRDNKNNMIPDPKKFPSGIKALADYVHSKGMKLGIYSDAAPLTCAGYTASLHFEEQDAKTFASWGVDYLKYDYCGAPSDAQTAQVRYRKMADALRKSGRDIVFSVCEWGERRPWTWASGIGGQLWRTTADIRDKWAKRPSEKWGHGVIDILDETADLHEFAGPGRWNDPDMLIVGLYGRKGPSGDGGGTGCNNVEYQSNMSLWSIMAAPLIATNDVRSMNAETKRILLNDEVIAVDQDPLGRQGQRKIKNDVWNVFVKPLANGDTAVAILNRSDVARPYKLEWSELGLTGNHVARDLWEQRTVGTQTNWSGTVVSHETKLFRLKKVGPNLRNGKAATNARISLNAS
ncbi:MAG: glycoside hydrolase family 27 protein [Pyrinomonadaceae bacterium]